MIGATPIRDDEPVETSRAVIERARTRLLAALEPLARPDMPYALLDFPDHTNIGDSAIWAGEEQLLRDLTGRPPGYVSTTDDLDVAECRRVTEGGTIFLHGGGNFGDIYRRHEAFRADVLRQLRDLTIVFLPQTIKYRDPANAAATAQAIAGHPDVHLFVRDQASLDFAARFDCPVMLVPDMAYGLGPLARVGRPSHAVLLHLRADVERVERDMGPFATLTDRVRSDWRREPRGYRRMIEARAAAQALLKGLPRHARRVARSNALVEARLGRGIALLSSARRVITDRLHGHILCTLLDIPHVALDNDYGKVHAYIAAWDADYEGVRMAATAQEAVNALPSITSASAIG